MKRYPVAQQKHEWQPKQFDNGKPDTAAEIRGRRLGPPEESPLAAASSWNAEDLLSPREIEIVRLVAKGLPNKTIAGVLEISPWTVATHVRRIFAKLGVSSRAAMIAQIYELGRANP